MEPGKRLDGVVADAVAGIDPEFEFGPDLGGIHDTGKFPPGLCRRGRITECAGMDFDHVRIDLVGDLDLVQIRVNEDAYLDTGVFQGGDRILDAVLMGDQIQPPFRGYLFSFFRNQGHRIGHDVQRDAQHFTGGGHFQNESGLDDLPEQAHVPVLDMTAVFSQVHHNGVCARGLRSHGRSDGIRIVDPPGLAQGGHMVYIYSQFCHVVIPFPVSEYR